MPNVKTGKRLFKVYMKRKFKNTLRKTSFFTQAFSKEQAERFAHIRKPGWTVTRIVEE